MLALSGAAADAIHAGITQNDLNPSRFEGYSNMMKQGLETCELTRNHSIMKTFPSRTSS